ncbi:MAG TPA: hypothetical protein VF950_22955 [Planctomycetota bacterium]
MPLLLALLASQDLTTEWIDRVSRDTLQAKGPLSFQPLKHTLNLGAFAAYSTNVNLEESDEEGQTVIIPFLRARLEYSERQVDAAADILANWKYYIPDHEASDDEERVYGRIRYVGPRLSLEGAEIFQHVSDPVDVVFADRVDRLLSDTIGRARLEASGTFALEAEVDLGIVRFQEKSFDEGDNWNLRGGLGLAARLTSALELVAEGGAFVIDYRYSTGAPPDAEGLFARGGLRGDLLPSLSLTALVGVARASSDDFASGVEGEEEETGEAAVHLKFEASPVLTLYGDYSRQFTFAVGTDPFQLVNRVVAAAEWDVTGEVRLLGRVQYDLAETSGGVEREYASAAASLRYRSHEQVFFDTGLTYRRGEVSPSDFDYDEWVLHVGFLITN